MIAFDRLRRAAPLGAGLIVFSSLFYASYGIWTKQMGDFFGGYTASAARSVLVLLLLLPVALIMRRFAAWNLRLTWPYMVGMVLASTLIWGPLYFAILQAGIGISLAVNYACIVIGMFVLGWLMSGERFTRDKQISTMLGFAGLALVFSPSFRGAGWLALGAAAVSGLATSMNMVLAKQIPYNSTQTTVVLWTTSVIANVPMAFLFGEPQPSVGWHIEWLYLVLFAIASVLASWSFVAGTKLIEAGTAGILGLLEIVFGVLFGVVLFAERPGPVVLVGVVTIILAAIIPYLPKRR